MGAKFDRKNQPRCVNLVDGKLCNHSQSFHGRDGGRCRALGCRCEIWQAPAAAPVAGSG